MQQVAVLQVKEYNELAERRWRNDWDNRKATSDSWFNQPQLVMYIFVTHLGGYRQSGYVAWFTNKSGGSSAFWRPTKHEALETALKEIGK